MSNSDKWNQIITNTILSFKNSDITQVNNLQSIQSLLFDRGEYQLVVSLIKEKNWEKLKTFQVDNRPCFKEFLDIITFYNQDKIVFTATIYDSDEMWQDPQIIDIFPLL